jgi:hypothetical protein
MQLDSAQYWVATWLLVQAFAQVESPLSGNFALEASFACSSVLQIDVASHWFGMEQNQDLSKFVARS